MPVVDPLDECIIEARKPQHYLKQLPRERELTTEGLGLGAWDLPAQWRNHVSTKESNECLVFVSREHNARL